MTKCPKCGEELVVSLVGRTKYCTNYEKCKGWFCFYCNKWHPYGTSCAEAEMNWNNVNDQHSYDNWCREHKEDIFRMLKDSGYYHCHDVDKYYPKDEEEDIGDYFSKELEELED